MPRFTNFPENARYWESQEGLRMTEMCLKPAV
jgi:hypothetical protein